MTPDQIRLAVDVARDLYMDQGLPAGLQQVADAAGLPVDAVHEEFGTVDGPLVRHYALLVDRCLATVAELAPPGPEERFGAFAFVMLDLLEEDLGYATATFDRYASPWGSPFRARLGSALDEMLDIDRVPGINRAVLSGTPSAFVTVQTFVTLIQAWLDDDSDDRERSTALLDRLVRFYAELAANQTASRGLDVLRYAAEAGYIPGASMVGDWFFGTSKDGATDDEAPSDPTPPSEEPTANG
ncbi:MAG: hypothetical protein JJ896_07285 [Rhodothermales bacterium]|nr:hypothetical protein [Rhodothermales bacterium]